MQVWHLVKALHVGFNAPAVGSVKPTVWKDPKASPLASGWEIMAENLARPAMQEDVPS